MRAFKFSWQKTKRSARDEVVEMVGAIISLVGTVFAYRTNIFGGILRNLDDSAKVLIYVIFAWLAYFLIKFHIFFVAELFKGESKLKLSIEFESPQQIYAAKWVNIKITNNSFHAFNNCGVRINEIIKKGESENLIIRDEFIVWPGFEFGRKTINPGITNVKYGAIAYTDEKNNKLIFSVQRSKDKYPVVDKGDYVVTITIDGDYLEWYEKSSEKVLISYKGGNEVECQKLKIDKLLRSPH